MHRVRTCITTLFSTLLLVAPAVAQAQTVTAAWDASPAADEVTGYQVCVGTSSLSCNVTLASVSASTTSYTFTPTGGTIYFIAIRATNAAGASPYSSEVSFSVPGFTQPLNQSSPAGTAITALNLSVSDPDGDSLAFTHTGLPPGLSLNGSTGRITGTPSAAGTYNVTVFVGDGLVTVSRSFVWTVTGTTSDTTAPAITITSHTSGQTLTSASVTISGTATDSGRGGNGVTTVTVNGQAATGGTVSNSNTANWSRALTLSSGANTISVEATDGAGNSNMQQITLNLNLPVAPVTGATLTSNIASPEDAGTTITFTAAGSGGVGPRQYKFLVAQGGGSAQTVQNWSTTSTYSWTPSTAATYTVSVWVRSAGVTADAAQASAQTSYVINTPPISPVTSATLTSNPSSPEDVGTTITFTAAGSGGVGPRQYKFLVAQGGGSAQTVQNWSTTSTYSWTPSTAATYTVSVWVRSAGVTADVAQASAQMSYVINTPPPSPVTSATLTSNPSSPEDAGTTITFTAAGSGGVGPRQYKFLVAQGGGSAQTVQNWSTTSTYSWTPSTAATYTVSVWVRSAGVTADVAQASAQMSYVINTPPPSPVTSATLTSNPSSPEDVGSTVTFTANGSGGVGPRQYKFRIAQGGGAAQTVQNWSTSTSYAWTPSTAGSYTVSVWVRSAGVTTDAPQASAQMAFVVTTPSTAPAVGAGSVTPSSGSGSTQTFALQYTDSVNANSISTAWTWFTAAFGSNSANSCLVYYDRTAGTLNLLNDAGNQWTPAALGTAATLGNSQCSVALAGSSVSVSGTTLTVNLAMTFAGSYAGSKQIYLYGTNTAGVNSGWQDRGDWTVSAPATAPPPVVTPGGTVSAVSVTPSSGSGTTQTFALQYSESGGASNLATSWVWFNETFASSSANSCLLYHNRPTGTLYLLNDAGSSWMSGTLGTNASLQNSNCSVSLSASSVSTSGTNLTLNLAMTFNAAYAGAKNVYLYGANAAGANSGWQDRGNWTVTNSAPPPPPPSGPSTVSAVSASPSSGSGSTQTFALRYSDSSSASNLATTWAWFTSTFGSNSARSCLVYYDRPGARLYLLNDAGDVWQSAALGGSGSIGNSQCSVALGGSSVSTSGTSLTLNLAMTFNSSYAGAKHVYLYGTNAAGANSGWQDRGDWTVSSAVPTGVSAVSATPSNGSGSARTFVLQYADSTGAANLASTWAWFNASFSSNSANSCLTYYDRVANRMFLLNDTATVWMPGTLGSGNVLSNSQCSITLSSSFVSVSGTNLTLNLAMSFRPEYAGSKNIYMYANNAGGTNSGWQQRGSWIVP